MAARPSTFELDKLRLKFARTNYAILADDLDRSRATCVLRHDRPVRQWLWSSPAPYFNL